MTWWQRKRFVLETRKQTVMREDGDCVRETMDSEDGRTIRGTVFLRQRHCVDKGRGLCWRDRDSVTIKEGSVLERQRQRDSRGRDCIGETQRA